MIVLKLNLANKNAQVKAKFGKKLHNVHTQLLYIFFKAKFGNKKWKIQIQLLRYYFFCRPNLKIYSTFYKRRICESSVQTTGDVWKANLGKQCTKTFDLNVVFKTPFKFWHVVSKVTFEFVHVFLQMSFYICTFCF